MEKVIIVGCPGAGKTTFAVALGAKLHIPVHHLDAHFWLKNWTPRPQEEFRHIQTELMQQDRWILDGNFKKSVPHRIAMADTIILFDFPKIVNLWRSFKRYLKHRGSMRPDMGSGNKEALRWKFIKYILLYPRKKFENDVISLAKGKTVIIFRNSKEVADFLANI